MSIAADRLSGRPDVPPLPVRRFTIEEYRRLAETGVLTENDRVELLEGWVVPKMVKSPLHDAAVSLVQSALTAMLTTGWHVRVQSAVTLQDSEPEPDLAVVRGSPRDFRDRHPGAGDMALVIEVADSSLERDRYKGNLYARAAIPGYWIVNLNESRIEAFDGPPHSEEKSEYSRVAYYETSHTIPLLIEDQQIAQIDVADLLP